MNINFNINLNTYLNTTVIKLHNDILTLKTKLNEANIELEYYKNKWNNLDKIEPVLAIPVAHFCDYDNSIIIYIESLKNHIKYLNLINKDLYLKNQIYSNLNISNNLNILHNGNISNNLNILNNFSISNNLLL